MKWWPYPGVIDFNMAAITCNLNIYLVFKFKYLNRGHIVPGNMNIQYGRHNREIEYLNRGDIGPGIMNIQYGRHNL